MGEERKVRSIFATRFDPFATFNNRCSFCYLNQVSTSCCFLFDSIHPLLQLGSLMKFLDVRDSILVGESRSIRCGNSLSRGLIDGDLRSFITNAAI